jgi:hypothetical protein
MHTDIHASSGNRTHDPSVRAGEDGSCLRPRGHCDGLLIRLVTTLIFLILVLGLCRSHKENISSSLEVLLSITFFQHDKQTWRNRNSSATLHSPILVIFITLNARYIFRNASQMILTSSPYQHNGLTCDLKIHFLA